MSRPQTVVERVEHLLHDSAPDEIAVLLNISEAEVRRIAQLLDERGPADPKPLPAEDVAAVVEVVDDLPDEPVIYGDDVRRLLSSDPDNADALARAALLTVAEHSGSRYDVEDLAGMLGLTGALTDWQPSTAALAREMAETFTQIDAAVDAITPEQIDARLADVISSAETWGVNATQAPMSEPGDATTGEQGPSIPVENHATPQVSAASNPASIVDDETLWLIARQAGKTEALGKPDTLAPTRPMTRALADHVNGYAGGMVRRCYCAPHPCSCDHEDGNDYPANSAAADFPDPAEAARRARDEAADRALEALHVHDPFPVVDEAGVWHAQCECGTRWDRATCDMCGLLVTALVIAETGMRRHKHHQASSTP